MRAFFPHTTNLPSGELWPPQVQGAVPPHSQPEAHWQGLPPGLTAKGPNSRASGAYLRQGWAGSGVEFWTHRGEDLVPQNCCNPEEVTHCEKMLGGPRVVRAPPATIFLLLVSAATGLGM